MCWQQGTEARGTRAMAAGQSPPGSGDRGLAVFGVIGSSCFLLALIAYNFVDIDLWHQMALMRDSMAAGHLLRADRYAYTPTIQPWIDHEWGAGAIAYFGALWLGGRTILVLKFLLALATYGLCWKGARSWEVDPSLFAVCSPLGLFLMHLGFFTTLRAQVYTFFFTALLVLIWRNLEEGRRSWGLLWLAVFPLWVNLHGGFVVGIGLTALYGAEKLLRGQTWHRFVLLCALMLMQVGLTPYGSSYFAYLHRALTMRRPYSPEWGGVWALGPFWTVCFLVTMGLTAYAVIAEGLGKAPGLLPLTATALEAALHRKPLPLFAILWLSHTPVYLGRTRLGDFSLAFMRRRQTFVLAAWVTVACASIAAVIRQKAWDLSVPQPIYPLGPVKYLTEQHCHGNLLVPFRLGAYVSWRLYPAIKVSLDSRYEEVFPDTVVQEIFDFYEAHPGWQHALKTYPPNFVLIPLEAPVAQHMRETGWRRIYHDRQFDIFTAPDNALPSVDWSALSFTGRFP